MSPVGYLLPVLHAHLPFVRHPEYPDFLEEDWLFEAIIETYVPLLLQLERARDRDLPLRATLSMSPPLCEMLADPVLGARFRRHLDKLRELIEKEVHRHREDSAFGRTARMYRTRLGEVAEVTAAPLLPRFRDLCDSGHLELLTCAATHGFLPLMSSDRARRAQLAVAVLTHTRHFGRRPRGIWLPECGWTPGLDRHLKAYGLDWFFVDAHAVALGEPRPAFGVYQPVRTPEGPCAFARDPESSRQVWSSAEGYPGDFHYREFYRDLGYDADYSYIRPYLHSDGVRRNLGIKYHRITGKVPLHHKEPYEPAAAAERAALHAHHFVESRRAQAAQLREALDRPPVIVAPYDAELYGHWWFEGPQFLGGVFAEIASAPEQLALTTAGEVLARGLPLQGQVPNASTWGDEGYAKVWLNGENAWMYRHQHRAEARMEALVDRFTPEAVAGRLPHRTRHALNQAARELLLAQSSDWAFIISGGQTKPYAVQRFRTHIDRFTRLWEQLERDEIDSGFLARLEAQDNCFPDLDFTVYSAS